MERLAIPTLQTYLAGPAPRKSHRPRKVERVASLYHQVRGRWCLVDQCPECRQFMHDEATQWLFIRAKFGEADGKRRTNDRWHVGRRNWCSACLNLPSTPVAPCDLCGKFGGYRKVHERDGTWDGINTYPPDPGSNYPRYHPRTCAPCGRRLIKAVSDLAETAEITRLINHLKRLSNGHKDRRVA